MFMADQGAYHLAGKWHFSGWIWWCWSHFSLQKEVRYLEDPLVRIRRCKSHSSLFRCSSAIQKIESTRNYNKPAFFPFPSVSGWPTLQNFVTVSQSQLHHCLGFCKLAMMSESDYSRALGSICRTFYQFMTVWVFLEILDKPSHILGSNSDLQIGCLKNVTYVPKFHV